MYVNISTKKISSTTFILRWKIPCRILRERTQATEETQFLMAIKSKSLPLCEKEREGIMRIYEARKFPSELRRTILPLKFFYFPSPYRLQISIFLFH